MSKYTIQDIFSLYGSEFLKSNKISKEQSKVFNSIIKCKTKDMGFHVITCKSCGESVTGFNSCRDRHCPLCQSYAREKWIQRETNNLLNCDYFHIITTVPAELNIIFMYNQKIMYNILFEATSEAILELGADPKWLGAKLGLTSILHTWGQKLDFHPHIHSIVTGGGLQNNQWIKSSEYLFKVQVLSSLYKNKFLSKLKSHLESIIFPEDLKYIHDEKTFNDYLRPLYNKTWITYIEPPKGSPENVIEYLGRYSFRIAISNDRIKSIKDNKIIFEYKDYKCGGEIKLMTLTPNEFIRRFLLHVLPKRYTKIKHYGLLSNRVKTNYLIICKNLIIKRNYNKKKRTLKRQIHAYECSSCGYNSFTYSFSYISKSG